MQKIFLRPHHINCIFFFEGKGYNEEFVINMRNIISNLDKNIIKFQTNCDCLCIKCPNKINNLCKDEEHIKLLDKLTIENYNLNLNKEYYFNEIVNSFYKNFDINKFKKICSSCEWYKSGVCSVGKVEQNKKKFLCGVDFLCGVGFGDPTPQRRRPNTTGREVALSKEQSK